MIPVPVSATETTTPSPWCASDFTDRTLGSSSAARTRWVTLLVGLGILATFPLQVVIGTSAPWRAFDTWLVQ